MIQFSRESILYAAVWNIICLKVRDLRQILGQSLGHIFFIPVIMVKKDCCHKHYSNNISTELIYIFLKITFKFYLDITGSRRLAEKLKENTMRLTM